MFRRHPRLAPLFVAALAATALVVVMVAAGDRGAAIGGNGETALVERTDTVDTSAIRLSTEHRRQPAASERLLTQRLLLLAVVAALGTMLVTSCRSANVRGQRGRLRPSSGLPQSGRAPPVFSF